MNVTVDYIISEGLINHHLFNSEEERRVKNIMYEAGLSRTFINVILNEFQVANVGIILPALVEPEFVIADEPPAPLRFSTCAGLEPLKNSKEN